MSKLQALLTITAVLCVGTTAAEAQCQTGVGPRYDVGYTGQVRVNDFGYSQFRPRVDYGGNPWSFSRACHECGRSQSGYRLGDYVPTWQRTNRLNRTNGINGPVCYDCSDPNCICDTPTSDYRSNYRPLSDYRSDRDYRSGIDYRSRFDDPWRSDFNRYDDFRSRDLDRDYRSRRDYDDLRFRNTQPRYNYTSTRSPNIVRWQTDLRRAAEQARAERRPMVVVFGADWCTYCKKMKAETFNDRRFVIEMNRVGFVPVQVDADRNQETVARLGIRSLPTTMIVGPDLKIVERVQGFRTAEQMTQILSRYGRSAEKDSDVKVASK